MQENEPWTIIQQGDSVEDRLEQAWAEYGEEQIKLNDILKVIGQRPLFGNRINMIITIDEGA